MLKTITLPATELDTILCALEQSAAASELRAREHTSRGYDVQAAMASARAQEKRDLVDYLAKST